MATRKDVKYEIGKNVEASIPLVSQGKFRLKKRDDIQDFGQGFAPRTDLITSNSYLEWQIGYDTIIGKDQKSTTLTGENFEFVGANGKRKYPYELSEIMYFMCKRGNFSQVEIEDLITRIADIKDFMKDKFFIKSKKEESLELNNVDFLASSTTLPTFITEVEGSQMLVEIMIQKQQYGTGIQPMLYLIVPVSAFDNSEDVVDHTSVATPFGIIHFGEENKNVISTLFSCFGMLSSAHNHDVIEILKVIEKNSY